MLFADSKNTTLPTTKLRYFWYLITAEIITVLILRIFIFSHYKGFFINDAYIFIRYAENMAYGHGLVYNIGEKVLGYSSPLYVVFLAGLKFISANLPFNVVVLVFNLLLFTISCIFLGLLIQNRGIFGLILFTIYCFYFPYVDASINGMGTILMITIIITALYAYKEGYMEASYILATISIVARPEGSLFLASILIVSILQKRRAPSITSIIICVSVLLIWLIPTYLYFGNILPESVMAKSSLFAGNEWSGIQSGFFEKGIMLMLGLSDKVYFSLGSTKIILWFVSFGMTILFVIGLFKGIKAYPTIVIAAIFFILLLFFYFLGSPVRMFSWYTILPSIIFMLVAAAGAEYLFNNIISSWLAQLGLGIIFLFCIGTILYGSPHRAKITHEVRKDKKLIHYLDKNASGIKSIMISDIGYIGYFKTWRIIDGSGLISPQVLRRKDGEKLPYLSDIFNKEKPDVIFFKVGILHSDIIKENMRYATFRDSTEKGYFLNDYKEVSNSKDFAEVFVRKSLLSNPAPKMLK